MYKIILAPMEGVLDYHMRNILSLHGGYDMVYTEFLRITNQLYKDNMFYKICPELHTNGYTANKTPVGLQLLGSDPSCMAENAQKAVSLGILHIDINFGCPAKKVNNSGGGAELLKCSDTLHRIVAAVSQAVPEHISVSVKMRLGYDNTDQFIDNIRAISEANPTHITVHARTKSQAYRGHADWDMLALARPFVDCPLFVNGDIVDTHTAGLAMSKSMADGMAIGRGALQTPNLGHVIRNAHTPYTWEQSLELVQQYMHTLDNYTPISFTTARVKQWFAQYLCPAYPQAKKIFQNLKTLDGEKFRKTLDNI